MQTIAVIDDERDIRTIMADVLGMEGFNVVCFPDVFHRPLADAKPDLILLDWILPSRIDHAQAFREIRGNPYLTGVPVIVMSAMPSVQSQAARMGLPFLSKPFNLYDLVVMVNDALGRNRPLRQATSQSSMTRTVE